MQIMQPKSDDPAQQQSNAILKFLPLMIGWFSLNVPAALCLYWVTNNIVTTATSVIIRNSMKSQPLKTGSSAAAAVTTPPAIFAPPREKPAGFGEVATKVSDDNVKPITAIDAEMVDDDDDDSSSAAADSKKRGKKKRKKN
jgi:YidC/Oxa1 family membrane protein insertase